MEGYEGIKNKLYDKEVDRAQHYQSKAVSKNIAQENHKRKVLDERNKKPGESPDKDVESTPEKKVEKELKEEKLPVKVEKGIQIKVQQEATPPEEEVKNEAEEGGYIESNNPYLYDMSGPKKVIDYGKPDAEQDGEDFTLLDVNG